MESCPEGMVWSDAKQECGAKSSQCGDRWFPETDGEHLMSKIN